MNAWDNLPNGKRIDAVLAHYELHPNRWDRVFALASRPERTAACAAATRHTATAGLGEMWDKVWDAIPDNRLNTIRALWDATRALITWDEAGDMLDMSVEEVQALAMVGIHAAVLLLPAAIAMNERK